MGFQIGELLKGTVVLEQHKEEEKLHRGKPKNRPDKEVSLYSLYKECKEIVRTQKDPTEDLVEFAKALTDADSIINCIGKNEPKGYLIIDTITEQTWFAHDTLCLNKNFIYREDIKIFEVSSRDEIIKIYREYNDNWSPGMVTGKCCYILDNPGNETYEVYYDSNYPSLHYGKATPSGCFIHKYKNRFHRDMAILELDELYTNSSHKDANEIADKALKPNQAIVISDGAWMNNVCAYSYFIIDKDSIKRQSAVHIPSEPDQAVLIAELKGGLESLRDCYLHKKTDITYYYDNTSIVNVFNNRKTEYIDEVKEFKDFMVKLNNEGYKINFVEIHPKTDENKDKENKALMYFHNCCDNECRYLSEVFKRDYKIYATMGNKEGKSLSEVSKGPAKKPNNNNNYRKPGNNVRR